MQSISGSGRKWPVMPEEADHLLVVRLQQGFHGAAFGEDLLYLIVRPDVVQLPKIEVVGVAAA